jgi:lysophospholipase L1-like esterase
MNKIFLSLTPRFSGVFADYEFLVNGFNRFSELAFRLLIIPAFLNFVTAFCFGTSSAQPKRFDFRACSPAPDFTQVLSSNRYTKVTGFGFDLGSKVASTSDGCTSDKPFFFSVALPEGNYNVTVVLGSSKHEAEMTVKAESRRLMLEGIHTQPGEFTNCAFTVNVRSPDLPGDNHVRLKPRELGPPLVLDWDEKLTLEFNGDAPSLRTLEITPADGTVTVFLAGDSTVTDQPVEPWNSWGQMLPRFFKPGVAIANHAESGESLHSFIGERRFDKITSLIKPGDYIFIQFGHNDQKDTRAGSGPFTTYKTNLSLFISEARKQGGTPVLITPMERKTGAVGNTLGGFPAAVRETAKQQKVALIDLNAMSKMLYVALGTNLDSAFQDGTHHNNYGSYELARCVVEGISSNNLPLASFLTPIRPHFDPTHPDPVNQFKIPPSPQYAAEKPEGN